MEQEEYEALKRGMLESFTWQTGVIALVATLVFILVGKLSGHLVRRSLVKRGRGGGAPSRLSASLKTATLSLSRSSRAHLGRASPGSGNTESIIRSAFSGPVRARPTRQLNRLSPGGNHSPRLTASRGTYVRMLRKNGLPSGAGSQFDSGTSPCGARLNRILSDPSWSLFKAE